MSDYSEYSAEQSESYDDVFSQELEFEPEMEQNYEQSYGSPMEEMEEEAFEGLEGPEGEEELLTGTEEAEWEGELNRHGKDYIRWVQVSLNKILGLHLSVDGIAGPQTRGAIRRFQASHSLVVDGVVGPRTEAALVAAGASPPTRTIILPPMVITAPTAVLDRFDFDKADLKPWHRPIIERLAGQIHQRWPTRRPVRSVRLVGHTDPAGTASYNVGLGRRRALAVRAALLGALNRRQRGLGLKVLLLVDSKGESEPIDPSHTAAANARNRRVEVFFSSGTRPHPHGTPPGRPPSVRPPAVRPPVVLPPPRVIHPPVVPTHPIPTTPPPAVCDRALYDRLSSSCRKSALMSLVRCLEQFGLNESAAWSAAASTLAGVGSTLEIPPLAVIIGILGGVPAVFLEARAKVRAAVCMLQIIRTYVTCMRNAHATSHCP